ncbi:ParA family protein [Sinomonas sp.]|uniref:ParA family protein n=1 Tax=Sinomonas sp. TaxID=1914986 RepID=UPI002FE10A13
MPQVVAVVNQKGGVGKTTETINLARVAANEGLRTLVVDADPQGNCSGILLEDVAADDLTLADVLLGEPVKEVRREGAWAGIDVVPGNSNISKAVMMLAGEHGREMRLREALDPVGEMYDLVLVDCAPSLELHTVNALAAADRALVVTTPGKFSLDGMSELEKSVASVVRYYNPLLTVAGVVVVQARATLTHRAWFGDLEQSSPWPIINPRIPYWDVIQSAQEAGLGLDEWTADRQRGREVYEMYARHFSALTGMSLRSHLEKAFPSHDYAHMEG